MNRILFALAFCLGAVAVIAMCSVFLGVDSLALGITVLIGLVFALGAIELSKYRRATQSLDSALASIPTFEHDDRNAFQQWLDRLDQSLRQATQVRIEGERVALPAPIVTPYFIGLLVMLGLLGTFVGMVDTLQGAVVALEGSTELAAIREGLAAPINGLGMAFGTSVAGVATSAMLGLMSTLCRRERIASTRLLDSKIQSELSQFSLNFQRQQTYKAIQIQADALPQLVESMQTMANGLSQMGSELGEKLNAQQNQFHGETRDAYTDLAGSVKQSIEQTVSELQSALAESGRLAGEALQPAMEQSVADLTQSVAQQVAETQTVLKQTASDQLSEISEQFALKTTDVAEAWQEAVTQQTQAHQAQMAHLESTVSDLQTGHTDTIQALMDRLESESRLRLEQTEKRANAELESLREQFETLSTQSANSWASASEALTQQQKEFVDEMSKERHTLTENYQNLVGALREETARWIASSDQLITAREENESRWLGEYQSRTEALSARLNEDLIALSEQERRRSEVASESMQALETRFAEQVAALAENIEAPMMRLIETSAEAPKAAAEVITQLRDEISNNIERDNKLLEERQKIMLELDSLAGSLTQSSDSQRDAIASLVGTSTEMLDNISERFNAHVEGEVGKLSEAAEQVVSNTAEMSCISEAISTAMDRFAESNGALAQSLDKIESALDASSARNNEQLSYYVSQARELIDHSVMSQKAMFDELRQISEPEHA